MQVLAILALLALATLPAAASDSSAPAEADVLVGDAQSYQPITVRRGTVSVDYPVSLRNRFEAINDFPLDRDGKELDKSFAWVTQFRIGSRVEWRPERAPVRLQAEYEHDLATGSVVGAPEIQGERLPNGEKAHNELRKLYGRITLGDFLVVSGGVNTSHWGMGLLANDGAHGWTPGSARFSDPRSGDRVIRVSIGVVPLTDYGLAVRIARDDVLGDDILLENESAEQFIFSATIGEGQRSAAGIYLVYRDQDSTRTHRGFHAFVTDLTGTTAFDIENLGTVTLAAEGVIITGGTSLGPSPDIPRHDLLQIGAVARVALDRGNHGYVFEILYASGDQNLDDHDNNAFKADPNHEFGLLLFRQVIAAQTGRGAFTAGNPLLVARVPDLERIPTGGSPTNTIALFPRAWWRPRNGLEAYGGPLFAFTEVKYTDPFNTRLAGGAPRNPLGGNPGEYWGTELDLGTRYRALLAASELTLGIEFGVLFPGSVFRNLAGNQMNEVVGGRAMIDYRL